MKLTTTQKISALTGLFRYRRQIKDLLIRRYWQGQKEWNLDFEGVTATFSTEDFYSNNWFFGPQDIGVVYEPAVTKLIMSCARNAAGFADIGANLGYFSVVAARANPLLPIISLEMDETLAPVIRHNLAINHIKTVTVESAAVGEGEGWVEYQPHPYSFLVNATQEQAQPSELFLKAPIVRVDDLFQRADFQPDLVKMDVDGAEMMALKHAESMLANPDLVLFLEVHPFHLPDFGSSAHAVGEFLSARGFSMYQIGAFRKAAEISLLPIDDLSSLATPTGDMLIVTRKPLKDLEALYK